MDDPAVADDGERKARHVGGGHQALDVLIERGAFVARIGVRMDGPGAAAERGEAA